MDRCLFALVNEGAKLLGEGIALRAVDIDIVYLNGYGFPAWRGGPMFYADTVGLGKFWRAFRNSKRVTAPICGRPRLFSSALHRKAGRSPIRREESVI